MNTCFPGIILSANSTRVSEGTQKAGRTPQMSEALGESIFPPEETQ